MQFPRLEKRKFVFIIGEEGAILTYFVGSKLKQRMFATWQSMESREALEKLLASDPKTPVYILLDLLELSCTQQTLPAVSSFNIKKLVKNRLSRDFSADDIKGAIPIGREKTGRKDWKFMFVSAHMAPPFSDWMDFLLNQKNGVAGIFMLPLEGEMLAKNLNKASHSKKGKEVKKTAEWQCIVLQNKVSGFRQVVLRNGRLVFTRLIHESDNELPGVQAGNIEQEIVNTLEYLRRLSFQDKAEIHILVFVSAEIKASFEISTIRGNPLEVYTPFELAEKLKVAMPAYQSDRFTDAVFCAGFANSHPAMRLHSPATRKLARLTLVNAYARAAMVLLTPLLALYLTYAYVEITRLKEITAFAEERKMALDRTWAEKQRQMDTMQSRNATEINDMVNLYRLISEGGESPLAIISKFNTLKGPNALVVSVNWQLLESEVSRQQQRKPTVSAVFNVELYNKGSSFEELFGTFDEFIRHIKNGFQGYKVEYTELPEKITLSERSQVIPVQIKITGSAL